MNRGCATHNARLGYRQLFAFFSFFAAKKFEAFVSASSCSKSVLRLCVSALKLLLNSYF